MSGKRYIAKLPSGAEVIRDFATGADGRGWGWRIDWSAGTAADGFRDGARSGWSGTLESMAQTTTRLTRDLVAQGYHRIGFEFAEMVDSGLPAGDLAAFLAQKG